MRTPKSPGEIVDLLESWITEGLTNSTDYTSKYYTPDRYMQSSMISSSCKSIAEGVLALAQVSDGRLVEHTVITEHMRVPGGLPGQFPHDMIIAWNQHVDEAIANAKIFVPDGFLKLLGIFLERSGNDLRVGLISPFLPNNKEVSRYYQEWFAESKTGVVVLSFGNNDGHLTESALRVATHPTGSAIPAKELFRQHVGITPRRYADGRSALLHPINADGSNMTTNSAPNPRIVHLPGIGQYLIDLAEVLTHTPAK